VIDCHVVRTALYDRRRDNESRLASPEPETPTLLDDEQKISKGDLMRAAGKGRDALTLYIYFATT
jgi:hypothetical protein